jgi:hypothetical protein
VSGDFAMSFVVASLTCSDVMLKIRVGKLVMEGMISVLEQLNLSP